MQFFRRLTLFLFMAATLGLAACRTEESGVQLRRVRFDQPADASKAILLGTANRPNREFVVPGMTRVRRATALFVVAAADQMAFVVDPGSEILEQLADVLLPPDLARAATAPPADAVLVSFVTQDTFEGIAALASRTVAGRPLVVYASRLHRPELEADARFTADLAARRVTLSDLTTGSPTQLSTTLRVTARSVWSARAIAFEFTGARHSLLYAPRLGRVNELAPPLRTLLSNVSVALLDGERSPREPERDPIQSALEAGAGIPRTQLSMQFLRIDPGDPLLDASRADRDALRRRGGDVAEDLSEFWL